MKCSIKSDLIKKALRILSPHESLRLPVSLKVQSDSIVLKLFDGIKFTTLSFSADVEREGEVIFAARYLKYLDGISEDSVVLQKYKDYLSFKGVGEFKIPFSSESEPCVPDTKPVGSVTTELPEFKGLFRKVAFAAGSDGTGDDMGYDFRCIMLECSDSLRAVATDQRVFAVASIPKGSLYRGTFNLPRAGVNALTKVGGEMITLSFFENAIGFSSSDIDMHCDIYIPESTMFLHKFEDILAVEGKTTLTGEKSVFQSVLSFMRKVDSYELEIRMDYGSNYAKRQPRFYVRETEGANAECYASGLDWKGEELKIKVNSKTLLDAIDRAEDGLVVICFTNDRAPYSLEDKTGRYKVILSSYSPAERR